MPSPLDHARHPTTSSDAAVDHQAAVPAAVPNRLPYAEILREFAALLGAQLAREHLAAACNATNTTQDQTD